jgi:hypothetical protein
MTTPEQQRQRIARLDSLRSTWPRFARTAPLAMATVLVAMIALVMYTMAGRGAAGSTPNQQPTSGTSFSMFHSHGHLFLSTDGGAHWARANEPNIASSADPVSYALSPTTRWMATTQFGASSSTITVSRTADDGQTWQQATLPAINRPYAQASDMQFLEGNYGWLVIDASLGHESTAALATTKDGGVSWAMSNLPFSGSIHFTSATKGWLVGGSWTTLRNQLALTQDSGATWTLQTQPSPASRDFQPVIGTPTFFDGMDGFLAVNYGQTTVVHVTHDGGATWTSGSSFTNTAGDEMALPIVAATARSAWVVMGHSLLVSHDAGASWSSLTHSQSLVGTVGLGFLNDSVGWALTENGSCASSKSNCSIQTRVLHSTDGGGTWSGVTIADLV